MSQLIRYLVLLAAVMGSGCSIGYQPDSTAVSLQLLRPAQGPAPVLLKQTVTLDAWGKQQQFMAISRLSYERSRMVALLPTGQQLMYLEYDGEQLIQQVLSSIELPAEDILAMVQFVLWPETALSGHYRPEQGWQLELSDKQRKLIHNDMLLLDVMYQGQQISIENHLEGYRVMIKTIEQKDSES